MQLKRLEVVGFKSFGNKAVFRFDAPITSIVGPNGSGKSNVVESIRFVLGEQSMKSLRGGSTSDLIFKSPNGRTMQRAAVSLVFDNRNRNFQLQSGSATIDVDFDEIELMREVYGDGSSSYRINGTVVRLRDILELIGSVNIGPSGHHIISQGEADRLLTASLRDRKAMLEEALGLKVYQYRIAESQRKLDKSRDHLRDVRMLTKELEPHMKYLRKQLDRLEQAEDLRVTLLDRTALLQSRHKESVGQKTTDLSAQMERVQSDIAQLASNEDVLVTKLGQVVDVREADRATIAERISMLESRERDVMRQSGKLEAAIERILDEIKKATTQQPKGPAHIAVGRVNELLGILRTDLGNARSRGSLSEIFDVISGIESKLENFESELLLVAPAIIDTTELNAELETLRAQFGTLEIELTTISADRSALQSELAQIAAESQIHMQGLRDAERELGQLRSEREKLFATRAMIEREQHDMQYRNESVDRLVAEVIQIAGELPEVSTQENSEVRDFAIEMRDVERLKIKFEELGGGVGIEVRDEWNETSERHAFLTREADDAETACRELEALLGELTQKLHIEFTTGLQKINTAFNTFFIHMFGGGGAEVRLSEIKPRKKQSTDSEDGLDEFEVFEEEEKEVEYGVEVRVQLPRKRVQDLTMLSGGERSLTSIALLFALSQVNPPPFVVLDETDAALDEANSRKYGNMLRELSTKAQLVVVTHNRETMAAAHQLFGVTIGSDGSSQVLSVKLEDAVQYAK